MNTFVDRQHELETLERLYGSPGSQLVVVYGRRRLGKTTLLSQFSHGKPCVYYMADRAAEVSQRNALARAVSASLDEPLLGQLQYTDWYDLFAALDRVRLPDQKLIVILDEYQYLCQAQPAFSSYVQKWWDEHWKNGNLMLVLCGSITSMMYRETLSHNSPLYGRSTAQILLRPLPYPYVKQFVSDPSERNCVERYALCGGIPRYLELLRDFPDFDAALQGAILDPTAPLHAEARYLLHDEIDVPNVCWSLLEAIASGATRISEMAARLAQPANGLTRYLSLLRDLSIVARDVPVLERNPAKSKRGLYAITDPFLRLWFGCIYPYESFFEINATEAIKGKLTPLIERHVQVCYEDLCRSYTRQAIAPETGAIKVGRQWGAHYEIDVAGVDMHNRVSLLGECKWSMQKVGLSILNRLQAVATTHNLELAANCKWLLFSRSGFTLELEQYAAAHDDVRLIRHLFA